MDHTTENTQQTDQQTWIRLHRKHSGRFGTLLGFDPVPAFRSLLQTAVPEQGPVRYWLVDTRRLPPARVIRLARDFAECSGRSFDYSFQRCCQGFPVPDEVVAEVRQRPLIPTDLLLLDLQRH